MDFVKQLSDEILATVAPRVADAVLRRVAEQLKNDLVFRYSEEEAAQKLGISTAALAELRKGKLIEFTYSIVPTRDEKGKPSGGRISYLPRHLEDFLTRNEQKRHFAKLKAA